MSDTGSRTGKVGNIGEAVATALDAAGEKNLEILGADVAGQCLLRGLALARSSARAP